MVGEAISIEQAAGQDSGDRSREQSTIAFPYMDLDAAVEVASAVYSRSGYGTCDLDELAAEMGQVISGAFRLKTGTAKIFDVVDKDGRSSLKLTDLGKQLISEETRRAARVEAFLRVPLYHAVYEKYKGNKLPPMKALEREIATLGVAPKQADKARQAFERSARQAGFFEAGDDRLVRPKVELPLSSSDRQDDHKPDHAERERDRERLKDDGGHSQQDPLIVGLVKRLPPSGTSWDADARVVWLRLATSIFDMVYGADRPIDVAINSQKRATDQ